MESVGPPGGVVGHLGHAVGLREKRLVISDRTLAVVIHRRVQDLLAETGEPDIRQTFDLVEEIVDLRCRQRIQAPVIPIFIRLKERVGLRVFRIVTLEKIMLKIRVALVIDERLEVQVRVRRRLPAKIDALTVLGNRPVTGQAVGAGIGFVIVQVIIHELRGAPLAHVQGSNPARRPRRAP